MADDLNISVGMVEEVEQEGKGLTPSSGERVWAGTFDPRKSALVGEVESHLHHRMLDPPGEEYVRDRDRESFSDALEKLNDGLNNLCHGMRQRIQDDASDRAYPQETDQSYPGSARSQLSSGLSKAPSAPRDSSSGHRQSSAASGPDSKGDEKGHRAHSRRRLKSQAGIAPSSSGYSSVKHELWVNDRVEKMMAELREAQSKLRPKVQQRAVLNDLASRLDGLERRSARAGHAPPSSRSQDAHSQFVSPQSLPTIRESSSLAAGSGVGQAPVRRLPPIPQHQVQAHQPQPPAYQPAHDGLAQAHQAHAVRMAQYFTPRGGALNPYQQANPYLPASDRYRGGAGGGQQGYFLPPIPANGLPQRAPNSGWYGGAGVDVFGVGVAGGPGQRPGPVFWSSYERGWVGSGADKHHRVEGSMHQFDMQQLPPARDSNGPEIGGSPRKLVSEKEWPRSSSRPDGDGATGSGAGVLARGKRGDKPSASSSGSEAASHKSEVASHKSRHTPAPPAPKARAPGGDRAQRPGPARRRAG